MWGGRRQVSDLADSGGACRRAGCTAGSRPGCAISNGLVVAGESNNVVHSTVCRTWVGGMGSGGGRRAERNFAVATVGSRAGGDNGKRARSSKRRAGPKAS